MPGWGGFDDSKQRHALIAPYGGSVGARQE